MVRGSGHGTCFGYWINSLRSAWWLLGFIMHTFPTLLRVKAF